MTNPNGAERRLGWDWPRRQFFRARLLEDSRRAIAVYESDLTWIAGARSTATTSAGELAFDEPVYAGGSGQGQEPVAAVLAALGASVLAGIAEAAAESGVTVDAIRIHTEGGVNLAATLGPRDQRPRIDRPQLEAEIVAAADRPRLESWLQEAIAASPIAGLFAAAGEPVEARLIPLATEV